MLIDENVLFKAITTPSLIQMEKSECGAASLGIVLWYYKAYVPLEELRVECGVTRDGSNAYNLVQTAKKYHFNCQSILIEDIEDLKHVKPPFVIHWDFNHFIVVEGMEGSHVFVNDPAFGRRKIALSSFDNSFTGVVIALEPNDEFKPIEGENLITSFLKPEIEKNKSLFTFLILNGLLLVFAGMLMPGFSKIFIDDILLNDNSEWFAYLILGMVFTAIIRNVLTYFQQTWTLKYKIHFIIDRSSALLWHLLHLPITFFQQRYIGDICYRSQAFQRIGVLLTNNITSSIINLFSIIFFITIISILSIKICAMLLISCVLIYCVYYFTRNKLKEYSIRFLQLSGKLNGIQVNGIQAIEMLKATSDQKNFFNKWSSTHAQVITSQQELYNLNQYTFILISSIVGIANVLILVIGAKSIMNGQLTAGTLVAIQSLAMSLFEPILTLFSFSQEIEKLKGDFVRVNDLLIHEKENYNQDTLPIEEKSTNEITFNNVNFSYSALDGPIISNISFACRTGEKISIVGPSGSGKSTVAKVAVRLLKPQSGQVLFNGNKLETISSSLFKHTIGYIDQEVLLFEDTLRSNLTLYSKDIDDDKIRKALADACILDFVNDRGGLKFFVEEGGKNLSLGQKQRIEIARTLLFDPKIIIMDEATSYLDELTEKQVLLNIAKRGCGVVIITHRFSAIQDSHQIIVLDKGTIACSGTHEFLMQNNSLYFELYKND